MDYEKVLDQFNEIAAIKGKAKQPLLKKYLWEQDFLKVTTYILDSSKKFNISRLKGGMIVHEDTNMGIFDFLDYMDSKRGATASDRATLHGLTKGSEAKYILVNKILRGKTDAGFTEKTVEKLYPGLIPYFPYMRCKGIGHLKNIVFPCFSQLKADGMYHERFDNVFRTRNGKRMDFSLVDTDQIDTSQPHQFSLMGECTMMNEDGSAVMDRRDSNAIINKSQYSDLSAEEAVRIDTVYWDVDYGDSLATYAERWNFLQTLGVNLIECRVVRDMDEAWEHYDEVRELDLEGTILKNFKGTRKDGNSPDEIKLKATLECELEVIGFVPGKDKYEGLIGSLICQSSCGGVLTDVGMGLSDKDRQQSSDYWMHKIITGRFNEVSKSKAKDTYALSHARLIDIRENKTEADDLGYILELKEAKRKK